MAENNSFMYVDWSLIEIFWEKATGTQGALKLLVTVISRDQVFFF